jgi:lambda family phage portal protein
VSTTSAILDHRGNPIKLDTDRLKPYAGLTPDGGRVFPYDASNVYDRETEGWYPQPYSPDFEYNIYRDRVVARARDLRRNDGWVSGGFTTILDNTVGASWRMQPRPDYQSLAIIDKAFDSDWADEFNQAVAGLWRTFTNDPNRYCDATRTQNFVQMMRMALAHKLVDGEDLIVLEWLPERMGYGAAYFATAIRVVDPDRLSNPFERIDTLYQRGGVDLDQDFAPTAYNIRKAHQYDWYGAVPSMIWERVPRETKWGRPIVIHDFDHDRADQHRGVPLLAPVMSRMKMMAKYDQVELQAAVLNAIFSLFVESPYDPEGLRQAADTSDANDLANWYWAGRKEWNKQRPLQLAAATVMAGFPGEKVTSLQAARPGSNHDAYTNYILRNVASGLGISAEQLTRDMSKVNYSSIRAGIVEATKTLIRRRKDFAANTSTPIYAAWLEEVVDLYPELMPRRAKRIPDFPEMRAAFSRCKWLGPAKGWVDPVKEVQAAVMRMDAGISTLEDECNEQGEDWRENLDQRAREIKAYKDKGIPLPKVYAAETAQEVEQKPRPE